MWGANRRAGMGSFCGVILESGCMGLGRGRGHAPRSMSLDAVWKSGVRKEVGVIGRASLNSEGDGDGGRERLVLDRPASPK